MLGYISDIGKKVIQGILSLGFGERLRLTAEQEFLVVDKRDPLYIRSAKIVSNHILKMEDLLPIIDKLECSNITRDFLLQQNTFIERMKLELYNECKQMIQLYDQRSASRGWIPNSSSFFGSSVSPINSRNEDSGIGLLSSFKSLSETRLRLINEIVSVRKANSKATKKFVAPVERNIDKDFFATTEELEDNHRIGNIFE